LKRLILALAWAACAGAQERARLTNMEAVTLYNRVVQLMESTTAAVPGLARAGAPLIETARQTVSTMRASNAALQDATLHYAFLGNLRAYLNLADSMPKPHPFPLEGRRQLGELRESADRIEPHFRALLDAKEAQLRSPDRDQLARYAEANAKLPPPAPGKQRVVFFGDSITDGWRLNEYFPDRDFVNRGIGGQITGQMLGRMKADVIDRRPAAMVVLAGTNDIGRGIPLAAIQNNLVMIADLAVAHQIKPIFASVLPIHDYHKETDPSFERSQQRPMSTIRDLNTWLAALCKQRGFTYLDYYSALLDTSGFLKAELADDGLHPNGAGYRVMAPLALAAIERTLGPAQPEASKKGRRK